MLPVILAVALTAANSFADDELDCGRERCERARGRAAAASSSAAPSFAAFEFAPASGTGMTAACACTSPTGVHGEVLTFTRSSSATCLKHSQTTGIANGDMVTCSSGQPRVMPGGDGTGARGLLNEGARTNLMLRTQALDDAAWVNINSGVAAPIVTPDAATAPDGTLTADRIQFPASSGANYSCIYQAVTVSAGTAYYDTAFVKGNGTTGSLEFRFTDGVTSTLVECAYNASTWVRCGGAFTCSVSPCYFEFGGLSGNGGNPSAAFDGFVWGSQLEAGRFESSYIATTAAAVTRAQEVATMPFVNGATSASFAATHVPVTSVIDWGADAEHATVALGKSGPAYEALLDLRAATTQSTFYAHSGAVGSGWGYNHGAIEYRTVGYWSGGPSATIGMITPDGSDSTGPATVVATTLIELGTYSSAANIFGVIKKVCADADSARCR